MADLLKVGTAAPDFTSKDQDGKSVSLHDYRGRPVVLYFYPKDSTPGCTAEACGFRDEFETFRKAQVPVLGVSADSVESHKKFQSKYGLNFTLVADADKTICKSYGTLGGLTGLPKRVTYLIGPDGTIRHLYEHVSPGGHSREVLAKLKELGF